MDVNNIEKIKEDLNNIEKIKEDYYKAFAVISKMKTSGSYLAVGINAALTELSPAVVLAWGFQLHLTASIVAEENPDQLDEINKEANKIANMFLNLGEDEPDLNLWKYLGIDTAKYK